MPLTVFRQAGPENEKLLDQVLWADSFFQRLKGLLGRAELGDSEGLLITPCSSVHTLGMKFSIDVLFLSESGQVQSIAENLRPRRWFASRHSTHALEMREGSVRRLGLSVGDRLTWK